VLANSKSAFNCNHYFLRKVSQYGKIMNILGIPLFDVFVLGETTHPKFLSQKIVFVAIWQFTVKIS